MARTGRYKVPFKRRREGKTDYALRRRMVISRKPRVVIRRSNKNISLQLVTSHMEGDQTHASASSYDLMKSFGWKGSTSNLPAAYLAGYLFGKRIMAKKVLKDEAAILDMGTQVKFYGSRIFTALKGVIDAGVDVTHSDKIFPPEERIRGEHIAAYAEQLAKEDPDRYNRIFSDYVKRKFKPEEIPSHFDEVKSNIDANASK